MKPDMKIKMGPKVRHKIGPGQQIDERPIHDLCEYRPAVDCADFRMAAVLC